VEPLQLEPGRFEAGEDWAASAWTEPELASRPEPTLSVPAEAAPALEERE